MADVTNLSQFLSDVADAIRTKKETTEPIPAENFDQEILSIETGSQINNQDKEITENGTYTADEGYTGLGNVIVDVTDPEYETNLSLTEQILGQGIILPYTPLNYIQTTGTQWIDTGVPMSTSLKLEILYYGIQSSGQCILGESGRGWYFYTSGFNGEPSTGMVECSGNLIKSFSSKSGDLLVKIDKDKILYDGSTYTDTGSITGSMLCNNGSNLTICNNGYFSSDKARCKIYYLKIYDGETLIRDFQPCKDGRHIVCLYDKVNNVFYYNQGTGDFTGE